MPSMGSALGDEFPTIYLLYNDHWNRDVRRPTSYFLRIVPNSRAHPSLTCMVIAFDKGEFRSPGAASLEAMTVSSPLLSRYQLQPPPPPPVRPSFSPLTLAVFPPCPFFCVDSRCTLLFRDHWISVHLVSSISSHWIRCPCSPSSATLLA